MRPSSRQSKKKGDPNKKESGSLSDIEEDFNKSNEEEEAYRIEQEEEQSKEEDEKEEEEEVVSETKNGKRKQKRKSTQISTQPELQRRYPQILTIRGLYESQNQMLREFSFLDAIIEETGSETIRLTLEYLHRDYKEINKQFQATLMNYFVESYVAPLLMDSMQQKTKRQVFRQIKNEILRLRKPGLKRYVILMNYICQQISQENKQQTYVLMLLDFILRPTPEHFSNLSLRCTHFRQRLCSLILLQHFYRTDRETRYTNFYCVWDDLFGSNFPISQYIGEDKIYRKKLRLNQGIRVTTEPSLRGYLHRNNETLESLSNSSNTNSNYNSASNSKESRTKNSSRSSQRENKSSSVKEGTPKRKPRQPKKQTIQPIKSPKTKKPRKKSIPVPSSRSESPNHKKKQNILEAEEYICPVFQQQNPVEGGVARNTRSRASQKSLFEQVQIRHLNRQQQALQQQVHQQEGQQVFIRQQMGEDQVAQESERISRREQLNPQVIQEEEQQQLLQQQQQLEVEEEESEKPIYFIDEEDEDDFQFELNPDGIHSGTLRRRTVFQNIQLDQLCTNPVEIILQNQPNQNRLEIRQTANSFLSSPNGQNPLASNQEGQNNSNNSSLISNVLIPQIRSNFRVLTPSNRAYLQQTQQVEVVQRTMSPNPRNQQ